MSPPPTTCNNSAVMLASVHTLRVRLLICLLTKHICRTLQVRRSFEVLDSDGDGFISAEDLVKELSRRPGGGRARRASMELAYEMLAEADKPQDGSFNFDEFTKMMQDP